MRVTYADENLKGTKKITTNNLFVGNIDEYLTEAHLRQYYQQFGEVIKVTFSTNSYCDPYKKNAFIEFTDPKSATVAGNHSGVFRQQMNSPMMPIDCKAFEEFIEMYNQNPQWYDSQNITDGPYQPQEYGGYRQMEANPIQAGYQPSGLELAEKRTVKPFGLSEYYRSETGGSDETADPNPCTEEEQSESELDCAQQDWFCQESNEITTTIRGYGFVTLLDLFNKRDPLCSAFLGKP